MVALIQSKFAKGLIGFASAENAGGIVAKRFFYTLAAAPAAGDILELGCLPAYHRLIDAILDGDDLDTGGSPAIVADVGIMSGSFGTNDNTRTCGAEIFSASTLFQAGGVLRPTLKTAFRTAITDADRSIGVKFTTIAATFAAGDIGLTLLYAAD
jgi:hypothetical protein